MKAGFLLFSILILLAGFCQGVPQTNEYNEVKFQRVQLGDRIIQNCMILPAGSIYPVLCSDCTANITFYDLGLGESFETERMIEYQTGQFYHINYYSHLEDGAELSIRTDCYSAEHGNATVTSKIAIGEGPDTEEGVGILAALLEGLRGDKTGVFEGMTAPSFSLFPESVNVMFDFFFQIGKKVLALDFIGFILTFLDYAFRFLKFIVGIFLDPVESFGKLYDYILWFGGALITSFFASFLFLEAAFIVKSFADTGSRGLFIWIEKYLNIHVRFLNFMVEMFSKLLKIFEIFYNMVDKMVTLIGRASPA